MLGFGRQRLRMATCYLRNGQVFLHASSTTAAGFYSATPPWLAADVTDAAQLGRNVLAALEGSKAKVPTPARDAVVLAPLFALAEVTSWGRFVAGAKAVQVEQLGERLTFRPMRNLGAKGGFEAIPELAFETGADEAGPGLARAMDLAEG